MSAALTEQDESEYERAVRELELVLARSRAREDWCIEQRDWLINLAKGQQKRREDNESQDRIGAATIAKLFDTASKFDRSAADERARQFEAAHDRMLVANERDMAGIGRRAH